MELLTAATKLNIMARQTDNQQEREALLLGVEALWRQAGYPPNLHGYVTIRKIRDENFCIFAYLLIDDKNNCKNLFCYLTQQSLDKLKAMLYHDGPVVTYSERTCYEDSKPLVLGVPVILGAENDLRDTVYFVSKIE